VRYLVAVYWAEGASDGRILIPIVERALEAWLLARARGPFDLLLQALSPLPEARTFVERVASLVQQSQGWVHVLFIHTDAGAGTTRRARRERIEPALQAAQALVPGWRTIVPVVPVRESEAWLLVDESAIRAAIGVPHGGAGLELPARARDVEHVLDPKRAFERAVRRVLRGPRALREWRAVQQGVAVRVPLNELRTVPAYREFEAELDGTLRRIPWL